VNWYLSTRKIIIIANPMETPFAGITGKSTLIIPWMNQRRIPAVSPSLYFEDIVELLG
jgi:hypothetical protein